MASAADAAREQADLRKRTCTRCLNGHHELCTAEKTCQHYLCDSVQFKDALEMTREASRHQRQPLVGSGQTARTARARTDTRPRPRDERPKEMVPMTTPIPPERRSAPDGMVWEAPPVPKRGGKRLTHTQVATLRGYPGEWARVKTYKTKQASVSAASTMRKDNEAGPGVWEYVGRELAEPITVSGEEHRGGLYVRYMGANEAEAQETERRIAEATAAVQDEEAATG